MLCVVCVCVLTGSLGFPDLDKHMRQHRQLSSLTELTQWNVDPLSVHNYCILEAVHIVPEFTHSWWNEEPHHKIWLGLFHKLNDVCSFKDNVAGVQVIFLPGKETMYRPRTFYPSPQKHSNTIDLEYGIWTIKNINKQTNKQTNKTVFLFINSILLYCGLYITSQLLWATVTVLSFRKTDWLRIKSSLASRWEKSVCKTCTPLRCSGAILQYFKS